MTNSQDPFKIYQKIHFIGIGGIGISALARILFTRGYQISGSDQTLSKNTEFLQAEGLDVKIGHTAENISADCDLVIHTTAIAQDNSELASARSRNLKILTYPQAVGWLTQNYQTIAVCGTHGKTTTTAMAALALTENNVDPTVIVGSLLREFDHKNERIGKSDYFVLEACEYQEAFLNYHPKIILLNNIDPEHLDYFQNEANYFAVFQKFLNQLHPEGLLVANIDDLNIQQLLNKNPQIKTITYGKSPAADYQITENHITKKLPQTSNIQDSSNEESFDLKLFLPGQHNIYNATAVIALSDHLQLDRQKTISAITNFHGANRRFEIKGKIGHTTIIDDYGHTPAEIQATLQGTQQFFGAEAKILCIFQPHQYSRTSYFLEEFGPSLSAASKVYIPNIYRSRDSEADVQKVNVDLLVETINKTSVNLAQNTHNFAETFQNIRENLPNYDVVITMGAGDITQLSDQIINLNFS